MSIRERLNSFRIFALEKIPTGWILPVLVSAYPIVFLYSYNVQELVPSQIVFPLIISCIGSLLLWIIFSLIARNNIKGGIIAAVFVAFFFAYGTLFDALTSIDLFYGIKHRHFLPVTLFITGYIGYLITTSKRSETLQNTFKIASFMFIFLLLINIFIIIPVEIQKSRMGLHRGDLLSGSGLYTGDSTANYPDIYYIVLDEYASFETLKTVWGYDNRKFKDFLEDRGFFVAEQSRTHSLSTYVVVPSILNMRPITDLHHTKDRLELMSLVNDNEAMRFLSTKGYHTIMVGSLIRAWNLNVKTDYIYTFQGDSDNYFFIDDFIFLLLERSITNPFLFVFQEKIVDDMDWRRNSRIFDFKSLTELYKIPSPKFVYAHILLPHEPFIFDKYGNRVKYEDRSNYRDKNIYLEQLIFTTKKVEETIDALLKQYPESKPPIIIIQSDHGLRTHHDGVNEYMPEDEPYKILNAFLLPGCDYQRLSYDIPPVEVLPLAVEYYIKQTGKKSGD